MPIDPERLARLRAKSIEHERARGDYDRPFDQEAALHGAFGKRPGGVHNSGGRPRVRWSMHPRAVLAAYSARTHTLTELSREAAVTGQTIRNRFHAAGLAFLPQTDRVALRCTDLHIEHPHVISAADIERLTASRSLVKVIHDLGAHPASVDTWRELVALAASDELVPLPSLEVTEGAEAPRGPQRRPRARRGGPPRTKWAVSIAECARRYEVEGQSLEQLSQAARVSRTTVRQRLMEHGVVMRKPGPEAWRPTHVR